MVKFVETLRFHQTLLIKHLTRVINRTTTEGEFQSIVKGSGNKLIVVDFTAAWCGPCQRIAPIFEQMAKEMTDVSFIKVDVDKNEETAAACNISAMPTFQFYKNGDKLEEFSGADVDKLKQTVMRLK